MPEEENISIDEALQRGIAAHKATDLRQANLYYSAILKAQPHHPDANHNMGILAISIGKIDVSIGYFENAIKSNNKNEQYWLSLINAYSDLGNFQKALNTIASVRKIISPSENFDFIEQTVLQQQAIKRKKDLKHEEKIPQELVDQLIDFYNSKKFNETVQKASLLLKSYPKSDALWNILGGAYNFLGKFDMALACYEQATLLKPNLPDNYFNIAVILNEKGNIDDAIVQYKQVLKIDPLYFKAHLNIGNIFQLKGDLLNAIKSYEAVLKINPEYIQAYFNLAEALKKSGKTQLAINAYNTVIEKDPNACYAFHNLGALYLDSGDLEKSIENCIKTIDCNPAFAEAHFNLATGLQRIGKLDSAIKSLKQAIKLKPDYADAMNNLGNMYQLKGDPQEAIRCFEKSLEINPELAPARANLIEILKVSRLLDLRFNNPLTRIDHKIRTDLETPETQTIFDDDFIPNVIAAIKSTPPDILKSQDSSLSQIYNRNEKSLNCSRHLKIFDNFGIIAKSCFSCYKVQINVPSVFELIKLSQIFYTAKLKGSPTRKCLIELRDQVPGFYKGLVYCRSLNHAQIIKDALDALISRNLEGIFSSNIKHGCSEFEFKHPEFRVLEENSKNYMRYPRNWEKTETEFDATYDIPIEKPYKTVSGICLSDICIIQKWIDYAKGLGDIDVVSMDDHPILHQSYHQIAVRRKAIYGCSAD